MWQGLCCGGRQALQQPFRNAELSPLPLHFRQGYWQSLGEKKGMPQSALLGEKLPVKEDVR